MNTHKLDTPELMLARSEIYKCLAACFASPDAAFFPSPDGFLRYRHNVGGFAPGFSDPAARLARATEACDREELLVEFSRLFLGPFHVLAAPYGSVYLDNGGTLMGESTIEVLAYYRAAGLNMNEGFVDIPDHIAVELEFMQYLCHKHWQAESEGENKLAHDFMLQQREFLERYLIPWVPLFASRMRESTENEVYEALGENLVGFIDLDLSSLQATKS